MHTDQEYDQLLRELNDERVRLAHVEYDAAHDELTGLLNRRGMEEVVMGLSRRLYGLRSPITLAILDLDDFKIVNDAEGHGAGDELLTTVANHLDHLASARHGVAVRMGGDEFAIVGSYRDILLADRIIKEVTEVHVSIGYTIGEPRAFTDLLRQADIALYHSKNVLGRSAARAWRPGMVMPAPNGRRLVRDGVMDFEGTL